jgi:hypothetical protein
LYCAGDDSALCERCSKKKWIEMHGRENVMEISVALDQDPAKYGLTFLGESAYDLVATVNRYAALAMRRIQDAFPGARVSMVIQNTVGWLRGAQVSSVFEKDEKEIEQEVNDLLDRLASEYDSYVVMRGGQGGEHVRDHVSD